MTPFQIFEQQVSGKLAHWSEFNRQEIFDQYFGDLLGYVMGLSPDASNEEQDDMVEELTESAWAAINEAEAKWQSIQ